MKTCTVPFCLYCQACCANKASWRFINKSIRLCFICQISELTGKLPSPTLQEEHNGTMAPSVALRAAPTWMYELLKVSIPHLQISSLPAELPCLFGVILLFPFVIKPVLFFLCWVEKHREDCHAHFMNSWPPVPILSSLSGSSLQQLY